MLASTHFGEDLTVLCGQKFDLDSNFGEVRLNGLCDIRPRLSRIMIHFDGKTIGKTSFLHQAFRLFQILLEWRFVNRTGKPSGMMVWCTLCVSGTMFF